MDVVLDGRKRREVQVSCSVVEKFFYMRLEESDVEGFLISVLGSCCNRRKNLKRTRERWRCTGSSRVSQYNDITGIVSQKLKIMFYVFRVLPPSFSRNVSGGREVRNFSKSNRLYRRPEPI